MSATDEYFGMHTWADITFPGESVALVLLAFNISVLRCYDIDNIATILTSLRKKAINVEKIIISTRILQHAKNARIVCYTKAKSGKNNTLFGHGILENRTVLPVIRVRFRVFILKKPLVHQRKS